MVLPLSTFITSRRVPPPNLNRPMYTSIPVSAVSGFQRIAHIGGSYKRWFRDFFHTPELVATVSIPITDILGDRPEWLKPDGSELGSTIKRKAIKFWRDNRGKETIREMLFDAFITGDGFLWKGKPSDNELKRAIKEAIITKEYQLNKFKLKELMIKAIQDEDLRKVRRIIAVASSTIKILHDEYEINGYEQESNGKISLFKPEDIIHFRYAAVNGRVQGFAPIESLTAEILLLDLVKQNMIAFMRNGCEIDKAFILPNEIANSQNHQYLINVLRKYKDIRNWHGNLVFTGELKIEDLQGNPKDMEFKDLALYVTSTIAYAYGIPVSRIPFLIGKSATKGGESGLAESGYWNRISDMQDTLEDLLNSQLFEELGWHIHFQRKYKQDEVREATTVQMNASSITSFQSILAKNKLQMTNQKMLRLLDFSEEDVEELKEIPMEMGNPGDRQNLLPKGQVEPEQDRQDYAQQRRHSANQKGNAEAVTNP